MAGIKGKCGGKRPNAGRKIVRKALVDMDDCVPTHENNVTATTQQVGNSITVDIDPKDDPVSFLVALMNDPVADYKTRMRAAITAAQYRNTRTRDGGKKDRQQDEANEVMATEVSKFRTMAAPRLTAVK